jgi:hypothetical protein
MADLEPIDGDEDALEYEGAPDASSEVPAANPEPPAQANEGSDAPSSAPIKRGRGRPKGYPKTGGRQKGGIKSYSAPEVRAELVAKSNLMERMARIATGEKIWSGSKDPLHKAEWRVPTIEQQQRALEWIGDKVLPALQATEVTGAEGKDLFPAADFDAANLARVLFDVGKENYVREISEKGMVVVDAAALPLAQRLLDVRQSPEDGAGLKSAAAAAKPSSETASGQESSSEAQAGPTGGTPAPISDGQSHEAPRSNLRDDIEPEENTIEVQDNGAYIVWVHRPDGSKKWDVRDHLDGHQGYRRSLSDARAFAQSLKGNR